MIDPEDEPLPEVLTVGEALENPEEAFTAYLEKRQRDFDLDPTGYFVKVWGYSEHDDEVEITDWPEVDLESLKAIDRLLRSARDHRRMTG